MGKRTGLALIVFAALAAAAFGQNFKGTYTMTAGTTKLTLALDQGAGGQIKGTLSSSTGAVFQVTGKIEEDIAMGTCQGQAGTSQFEASFEGSLLIFTLMEVSPGGEVSSRSLEFTRVGGAGTGAADAPGLPPTEPRQAAPKPGAAAPRPTAPPQPSGTGNVVNVPELGCSFKIPAGWSGQKQGESVYLTSTSYKGFILISGHEYTSLQEMAQEAAQGIVDESSSARLMPISQFQPFGKNGMVGEFSGVAQGQKARTFAIGLIAPRGGGVTIMAAAEEASYSSDYSDFVLAIAGSLSFSGGGTAAGPRTAGPQGGGDMDLMRYFAGEWYSYSSGSTMYGGAGTERKMTLCPDGNYRDSSEFSASGAGEWGAAAAQGGWGRWTIQGDKTRGTIVVTYPNGQTRRFPYQIISKEEQTISFDGVTYVFAGAAQCR